MKTHPEWMKANVDSSKEADIQAVLLTPVTKVSKGAAPHLDGVSLWGLKDFRAWAENAIAIIRELRTTFYEPGDLIWRMKAMEEFTKHGMDAPGLLTDLRAKPAKEILSVGN